MTHSIAIRILHRSCQYLLLSLLLSVAMPAHAYAQVPHGELLHNSGFEGGGGADGNGGGVPEWGAFGLGYEIDRTTPHMGDQCIRCDSLQQKAVHGAQADITLNQARPTAIEVTGWSKADKVSGVRDGDYSIYVDLTYMDGTPLWGQVSPFAVGTHDWERRHLLIVPQKPVRTMRIYALFRSHTGSAWFDDFSAHQLDGAGIFDSQPLLPLPIREGSSAGGGSVTSHNGLMLHMDADADITMMRSGAQQISNEERGGFYIRDVGTDGRLVAVRAPAQVYRQTGLNLSCAPENLGLKFSARIVPDGDAISIDGEMTDTTNQDRAMTVYLALPVGAAGWNWGQDIRRFDVIGAGHEYANLTHVSVGANGGLSLYPFGAVWKGDNGIGIASQMDWPSVYRIFYNGTTRQFVIAWDVALTGKTAAWPSHNARFRCKLFRLPAGEGRWGFRAATEAFYKLNAPNFNRLAKKDGIWMPFTNPAIVSHLEDFGFAYHEGDNSMKSDDALGILSFRYTEPMSWWMVMPGEMPRTYEAAMGLVHKLAAEPQTSDPAKYARALLNSGSQDASGKFNLEFRNEPWANGAVFVLDPNPEIAATAERPTKAYLSYTVEAAQKMYGQDAARRNGIQDGEYLDSLESWADVQDYRPQDLAACPYPIPFDTDSRVPTLPQWYSTHTFARFLRDDLHNRGKLLMANTTPVRFTVFSSLFDVSGIEVNWLGPNGEFRPDSDDVFNLRRTMSNQKPYLLLMNTDFDKFTPDMVEKYFQRCLFYGVFPSMFSVNAADKPYWDNPKWYNRDRPLFKRYIPIIQRLSKAGWQPVTRAVGSAHVYVERYGTRMFTVLNDTKIPVSASVAIDGPPIGLETAAVQAHDLMTGALLPTNRISSIVTVDVKLQPGESLAFELK